MRNLLKWTLFALPLMVLSCTEDKDKTLDGDKIPVTLSAGIKTRAVDASWINGDCIGLTSFKTGTNNPLNKMHNCRYSTGGDGNFDADDQNRLYYPLDGSEVDLLGYYPYQEGLLEDHVYDIDVNNQSSLPDIDLMTFSRHVGASKNKPNVTVTFRHRLTKLLFNITHEDATKNRKIKSLSINGMHTTGDFNIFEQECIKHTGSKKSIDVPVTEAKTAKAIVLPHNAGEGVSFTITLEDGTLYSIALDQSQELKTGTKYTFNILLRDKETPTVIKGIIQDWDDGGILELQGTAFIAEQDPGQTVNFAADDQVTLYCGTQELTTFTYDGSKWTSESPIYWENIGDGVSETVDIHAKFVRTAALDETQLPEVLLAKTTVNRFEGVSFNFSLVPTKVVFQLKSEATEADQRFSLDELNSAVIQLPDYTNEYTIDHGVFTKGTGTGNIQVVDNTALLIPQSRDGELAIITINGHKYSVSLKESMNLEAGKVYTFIVNITRTEVSSFSVSYTDWAFGGNTDVTATPISLEQTPGSTVGSFKVNDKIAVYYENTELTTFKYNGTMWSTDSPIYWENVGDGISEKVFLHATYIRSSKTDNSQLDEFMLAKGEINRFSGLNFSFALAPSKVIFELKSDGSFTKEQLETASIQLLDLTTDYTLDKGTLIPGATKGNINVVDYTALVVPQSKSGKLANIILNGNTYQINLPNSITFEAGLSHKVSVTINKNQMAFLSVSYTDWDTGGGITTAATPVNLQVSAGTTEDFTSGNQITLYSGTTNLATYTYTSGSWTTDTPLYWENIGDGTSVTAPIKAIFTRETALHSTQLPEVFLASTTATRFQGVKLEFKLVPAKVVFNLTSESSVAGEKFTAAQLSNATIKLPGYVTGYTLNNAEFTIQNSTTGTITTASKKALIIPQAKSGTLAEITIDNNTYTVNSASAISYQAGYVTTLTVNILKTEVSSISASYTDWENDNTENNLTAFIFSGTSTTTMFDANDKFTLYYDKTGEAGKKINDFVYNGTNAWNSTPPTYWEDLEQKDTYNFYATCELNEPLANNQMADIMYAKASGVSRFGVMTLDFTKKTSRVIIKLKSSDTSFSDTELGGASIYLPNYKMGATYNGVNFQTGTAGIITTKKTDGELNWVALIESQTILKDNTLIKITIAGNDYFVTAKANVDFDVAKTHTYSIDIKKGEINFTTGYADWEPGDNPEDINVELE